MDGETIIRWPYRIWRVLLAGMVALILIYLILPQFIVIPLSFSDKSYLTFPPTGWSLQWYQHVAGNPSWAEAMMNSLMIGIPAATLSMIFGTLAALSIKRGEWVSASVLSAIVIAPMMLPHVILAIGLYPLLLSMGLLGTHLATIVGHTIIGIPLVFVTVNASLASYNTSLELAAMTLGANPWQCFWRVTFPLIAVGIVIGGILAFASSFDELMLALFLTGAGTRTLPRLIWEQLNEFLTPTIAAVATLIFVFTLLMLALVSTLQWLAGRKEVRQ